jgi:hypothetical protein
VVLAAALTRPPGRDRRDGYPGGPNAPSLCFCHDMVTVVCTHARPIEASHTCCPRCRSPCARKIRCIGLPHRWCTPNSAQAWCLVVCKNGRLHPSVALVRHVAYCMRPSSSCTPRHLVTPCIPAYVYQDWFLVLHLANLDAQKD